MSEREKKQPISIRLSTTEYETIKAYATANKQSVSRYIAEKALSDQTLNPARQRMAYQHLIIIKDYASQTDQHKNIEGECNQLWQLLRL